MAFNIKNNPYASNPTAGFSGAMQGASAGAAISPVGAAVGAAAGMVGGGIADALSVRSNLKNLNTGVNAMELDEQGRPIYQIDDVRRAQGELQQLQEAQKFNNLSLLGIASPFGTSPIVGQLLNRRRRGKKIDELKQNIEGGVNRFNRANMDYAQNQLAKEQYFNQLNDPNRLYNLYR